ncbi:uncharacterized protein LOC127007579 [Eriocheir sinensis]|uniref:uncharacterized protein LOC127007579 n=1 Tax=Eriocheir sinensis TaxID=95602 RepID=UPI0021C7538C|nr:uncharacterized protein LOC127007579 [Eriocheir sinensis]
MALKSRSPRLPRLGVLGQPTDEWRGASSPRDFRGASPSRQQERHSGRLVLLPVLADGEEHPMPYYETSDELLRAAQPKPRREEERRLKSQAQVFDNDPRLQKMLLDEVLEDALAEEVVAVASVVLEESKYKEDEDKRAAGLVEEELIMPEVKQQVYISVWELLYDLGRALPRDEFMELKKREKELKLHPVARQALLAHVSEGEKWTDNLKEEKILSELPWDALVYNYYKNLQENAMSKNVALRTLQERVVAAAAGEEIESVLVEALEDEVKQLDTMEKVASPPRHT